MLICEPRERVDTKETLWSQLSSDPVLLPGEYVESGESIEWDIQEKRSNEMNRIEILSREVYRDKSNRIDKSSYCKQYTYLTPVLKSSNELL